VKFSLKNLIWFVTVSAIVIRTSIYVHEQNTPQWKKDTAGMKIDTRRYEDEGWQDVSGPLSEQAQ
jgi:hypothetical protein